MLERNVEIGKNFSVSHQGNNVVDMRIGVNVVQPHPGAEVAQRRAQIQEASFQRLAAPRTFRILEIKTVGARVLTNDQQLLDAGAHQALRFDHDMVRRPAREIAAQRRDDAKRAAVVAALGDFQIGVMTRREAQTLGRHQVDVGIMQRWHRVVHGRNHLLILMGARNGQHARVGCPNAALFDAEAAGDDDAAV